MLGKRLAIWGLFLALLYLTRDFFFIAFMTFLFSYLALAVVGWIMNAFFPARSDRACDGLSRWRSL